MLAVLLPAIAGWAAEAGITTLLFLLGQIMAKKGGGALVKSLLGKKAGELGSEVAGKLAASKAGGLVGKGLSKVPYAKRLAAKPTGEAVANTLGEMGGMLGGMGAVTGYEMLRPTGEPTAPSVPDMSIPLLQTSTDPSDDADLMRALQAYMMMQNQNPRTRTGGLV
jgi:hypothetical protein